MSLPALCSGGHSSPQLPAGQPGQCVTAASLWPTDSSQYREDLGGRPHAQEGLLNGLLEDSTALAMALESKWRQ